MDNFFLSLYKKFNQMGMNTTDLDSMLNILPWKEEHKKDGTVFYTCDITTGNENA